MSVCVCVCVCVHLFVCVWTVAGLPESTLTLTQKGVKEVMQLDDEIFSKFYSHTQQISHSAAVEISGDFDAIFDPNTPK